MEANRRFLVLYRQLLRKAKQLPEQDRQKEQIKSIKDFFRTKLKAGNDGELDTDALIAFMDSKLGYLKIVTAKRPKEKLFGVDDVSENGSLSSKAMNELKKSSGKQRFVMINGKLVESDAKEVPRALRTSVDPDDLARHNHLLQRQYFMHRK